MDRQRDGLMARPMNEQTDRQTDGWTIMQIDRQTENWTDRQKGSLVERQAG
jgi:hypothetical protein